MSKAEVQRRIGVTCWEIESLCSRLSISLGRFGSGLTSNERRRINVECKQHWECGNHESIKSIFKTGVNKQWRGRETFAKTKHISKTP